MMFEPNWEDDLMSMLLNHMNEDKAWEIIEYVSSLKLEWQREVADPYDDDDFYSTFYGSDYGDNQ